MNRKTVIAAGLMLALGGASGTAAAFEPGDWLMKLGVHAVNPKSDNGSLAGDTLDVEIDTNARPSFQIEYFLNQHWGLEVLAALPFEHDVNLNGTHAATIKHLPPTVSLQYHFAPSERVSPFVGLGLNYTWIYSEDTTGPLNGTKLALDNSWGLAAHAGVDFKLNNGWYVGADLRWMDIDSDARVNGAGVGTVHVDPLTYGFYVGFVF